MAKVGRPRQVEDDAVFTAMAEVLLRVGWSRLSLNLVAAELGVTAAALRQRFGGRRQLLVAFHGWSRDALRATDREPPVEASPLDALWAMIRDSVVSTSTPERMLNALSLSTEIGADPELRRLTHERFALAVDRTATLLERAVDCGELERVDTAALARLLQHCLFGTSFAWAMSGEPDGRRPIADELVAAAGQLLAPYRREDRTDERDGD